MSKPPPVAPDGLTLFARQVYERLGVPEQDAGILADTLVQADLWGHQSHGVMQLSWYAARESKRA